MSGIPAKDLANIRYGGFYIPVLSWFYIYFKRGNNEILPILLVALFGAIIWHATYRSIFGPEGPEKNPKHKLTVAGYYLAFCLYRIPAELRIRSMS